MKNTERQKDKERRKKWKTKWQKDEKIESHKTEKQKDRKTKKVVQKDKNIKRGKEWKDIKTELRNDRGTKKTERQIDRKTKRQHYKKALKKTQRASRRIPMN